jgi:PPOX class probable F420-dependent enzyme
MSKWMARAVRIENRFLDWGRSPKAARVATDAPTGSMDDFRGRKYCVLVSYRKNGDAIPSPLWFGVGNGKLYVHTAGVKVKRVERNPNIRIAPSTFRGRPKGAPIEGTARVLSSGAEADAEHWIAANYGWERRAYLRLFGQKDVGVYLEVTPAVVPR